MENSLIELKKHQFDKLPRIIEGYDITNIWCNLSLVQKLLKMQKPNKKEI